MSRPSTGGAARKPAPLAIARRALQVLRAWLRHFVLPWLARRGAVGRAARAQAALEDLGGAWVKLGQALALRFDVLPEDYCLQFFRLLNRVRPFPAGDVRRVVEAELGRPLEACYRRFDLTPVASASIGQVHRATLADGTEVAVKVQRPGVDRLIRADLALMRGIALVVDVVPWAGEPRARRLVEELARWTEEELDYRREAEHAALLASNAVGDRLEKNPRVYPGHTARRVLTLEWLEGVPVIDVITALRAGDASFLAGLARRGHDPARIASHIVWNALNQIYRQGCFHADPHPANLIVLPGDAIGYVDFGIVGRLDPATTDALRDFARSLFAGQVERAVATFTRFLTPSHRTDLVAAHRDLVEVLKGYADSSRVAPSGSAPQGLFEVEMLDVVRRHAMSLSPDATLYLKAVLTAEALVKELDPGFDLVAHENRFFARLARIETREALHPARLGQLLLDLRARAGGVLAALDSLPTAPARIGLVASDVRSRVESLFAVAIAAWLGVGALVWTVGGRSAPAVAAALAVLALLLLALRQVRRLPRHGEHVHPAGYPRRIR